MRNSLNKLSNKAKAVAEPCAKWCVRMFFEAIKLAALGWTVLYFVAAPAVFEYLVAGIIVFAAAWFTLKK